MSFESKHNKIQIDHSNDENCKSYPCSIVWGYLPLITTCLPVIGHMGITDSNGQIHDFQGPYTVSKGRFMTGSVYRYLKLEINSNDVENQDKALRRASMSFKKESYNLFYNNCHNQVGRVLQEQKYKEQAWPSMVDVWVLQFRMSWNGCSKFCIVMLPWIVFIAILVIINQPNWEVLIDLFGFK